MTERKQYRENDVRITALLSEIAQRADEITKILASEGDPCMLRCRNLDTNPGSYLHHGYDEGFCAKFVADKGRKYRISVVRDNPKGFWGFISGRLG